MSLRNIINQFYYEMSLNELRLMNDNKAFPNLSYNSFLYLNVISYKDDCTISMLADILQVTKSAVTIKVNELVKQGYLEKVQSEGDRRVHYLKLTGEVTRMFDLYDTVDNQIIKSLEQAYSKEEIAVFQDMLGFIVKNYQGGQQNEHQ